MNERETPLDDLTIIGGSVVLKRTKLDMMDANVLAGIQIGRKHFQELIDRGELIRRDELVKWLEEQKPIREHNWPLQNVIDHLKKP